MHMGLFVRTASVSLVLVSGLFGSLAEARVTRLVVEQRRVFAEGREFLTVGSYERLDGTVYMEVDPEDPLNAVIVNLDRAPRNARGLVEFSTKFYILKPVEEHGRLSGPGVYDMKAGIAIAMLAIRALQSQEALPRRRIVVLLTSDEERGSRTSQPLIEQEARRSDAVLVLEPSLANGALKTSRKGAGEFRLEVRGVAAHAGIEPEKGASAIHELARQVVALEALRDSGISVNVGLVEGGSRPNVVAEQATCVIDVRVSTAAERARVEEAFGGLTPALRGTSVQVRGSFSRPPLERTEPGVRLYQVAREVASELGHELGEGSTGGGSDGNFTAALGVPTLDGLGAVGAGAHALHECVEVAELPWRAALVAGLVYRLDSVQTL